MAERQVAGKDILLMIDPAGGTSYKTIVCLTSNGLKRTTSIIDAASKCGSSSTPGAQTVTVDFTGQVVVSPDVTHVSEGDLHDLWQASTNIGWAMGPAVPVAGDVTYNGQGFISDLSDTFDMNGATFTGTLSVGLGGVTKVVTA